MPTLLCFGDSNTHGTPPMREVGDLVPRYPPEVRWPGVCAAALGPNWTLIEEGLPGRNAQGPDPILGDHMDGKFGLKIALGCHRPIDWLVIMLGTNDVRTCLTSDPDVVTAGIATLLEIAHQPDVQLRQGGFKTVLVAPPPILEQGPFAASLHKGAAASAGLAERYAGVAASYGAAFLDAAPLISVSPVDGVHFEAAEHAVLGRAIADVIAV